MRIALFLLLFCGQAWGATWYIDQTAASSTNAGSQSNPWKSFYDSAYGTNSGSVAAGDTIECVAGSGVYYEATNSTSGLRVRATDISFSASGKTITTAGAVSFTSYNTADKTIRVTGSASNDGQYTVASATATVITLNSSNALVDESAGASIRVIDITPASSGVFSWDTGRNGSAAAPIKWNLNGCEISAGLPITGSGYLWNKSANGTNEYYVRRSNGSNPSLVRPRSIITDGNFRIWSAGDADRTSGTVGSLSSVGEFGYGDNDSLGYSTIYVRTAGGPPGDAVAGQIPYVYWANWGDHIVRGGVLSFGNGTATSSAVNHNGATIFGRGARLQFERNIIRFADGHGFEANASGPFTLYANTCIWSGHRCLFISGNVTLNSYNTTDWGSHLGLLMGSVGDGLTGTVNLYNSIFANEEAGAIDKKSATMTLNEGDNLFYPRMTAAGGALGYVSTANWATTAATDIPASTATTTSSQGALTDPLFVSTPPDTQTNSPGSFFRLRANSPARRVGLDLNVGNVQDCANRAFMRPPSMGACEAASGDAAAARTAR